MKWIKRDQGGRTHFFNLEKVRSITFLEGFDENKPTIILYYDDDREKSELVIGEIFEDEHFSSNDNEVQKMIDEITSIPIEDNEKDNEYY